MAPIHMTLAFGGTLNTNSHKQTNSRGQILGKNIQMHKPIVHISNVMIDFKFNKFEILICEIFILRPII